MQRVNLGQLSFWVVMLALNLPLCHSPLPGIHQCVGARIFMASEPSITVTACLRKYEEKQDQNQCQLLYSSLVNILAF